MEGLSIAVSGYSQHFPGPISTFVLSTPGMKWRIFGSTHCLVFILTSEILSPASIIRYFNGDSDGWLSFFLLLVSFISFSFCFSIDVMSISVFALLLRMKLELLPYYDIYVCKSGRIAFCDYKQRSDSYEYLFFTPLVFGTLNVVN